MHAGGPSIVFAFCRPLARFGGWRRLVPHAHVPDTRAAVACNKFVIAPALHSTYPHGESVGSRCRSTDTRYEIQLLGPAYLGSRGHQAA